MELTNTQVVWRDLTLDGRDGPLTINSLEGWEELPGTRTSWEARPAGHGSFDGPVWATERVVTVSGLCRTPAERDALLVRLQASMFLPGDSPAEPLTVTNAGRTLTAYGRLTRFKPTVAGGMWGAGLFGWAAQWECPDPYRYGPVQVDAAGLPVLRGGLRFPLFTGLSRALTFGPMSTTGRVLLTNPGTAPAWPVFQVTGPLPDFALQEVATGRRLEFQATIPAGSVLSVDSSTGLVLLDGVADRSGQMVRREWTPVPAGGVSEWAFTSSVFDPAAQVTASVRPTYW